MKKMIKGITLLVLLLLVACGNESNNVIDMEKSYMCDFGVVYNAYGEVIYDETMVEDLYWSLDKTTVAFVDENGALFVVRDDEVRKITEERATGIVISDYGDTVAFIENAAWQKGKLFIYNVSKGELTQIDEDVSEENLILAPDGKAVAYIKGEYGDLYVSKKGKEGKLLYEESTPIAITNGGKSVYYTLNESDRFMYLDGEELKVETEYGYYFNADNTEVLYNTFEGAFYYIEKGNKYVQLTDDDNVAGVLHMGTGAVMKERWYVRKNAVKTFDGTIADIGSMVGYISKKAKKVKINEFGFEEYQVSADGSKVMYTEYGRLQYIKNAKKSMKAKTLGKELEVDFFLTSADMKKVYYIFEGDLFCLNGKKGVRLVRGFGDYEDFVYSDKYDKLYYVYDEELYCVGTKENSIRQLTEGIEVERIWRFGENIFFSAYDEEKKGALYMVSKEKEVTKIFDDKWE